ncbi:zinc-binding alcohol dehydrogenase family protein [Belnapia sp. T18]|uniref:Zinc-type alcohol dehydrogenase-like protein n=1 Tax=Belnapia arida TaxID=2804533 RepID=A0ABS1U593_9PROT|nr:zinc-binding alcohol dehydrogenase family protein [Belnapia arida]MBL6079844.1 zinc-binding alcohol dehydrogenase family protein [Belnapia arida]
MFAIGYRTPSPITAPDALIELDLPKPTPGPRDLLVAVEAVSVNPVDVKRRAAAAPPPGEARVLGFDAAGTVEAVGAEVTLFRPGDQVFYAGAIDRPGSNATHQLVDERIVGPKPRSLGFAEAAALPLTAITAWELLFDRLGISRDGGEGQSLLIVNGAGGVGSILTQIARRLTRLTVIATASRPETADWCRAMGAHHVIDHRRPLDEGLAAIGLPAVSHIASLTATDRHWPAIERAIAPQGHVAIIDDPQSLDIVPFKRKSVSLHWELMFTRSLFGTPDMAEQHRLLAEVSRLVDAGTLRTTMTHHGGRIDAASLRALHTLVESGRSIGKAVLAGFG